MQECSGSYNHIIVVNFFMALLLAIDEKIHDFWSIATSNRYGVMSECFMEFLSKFNLKEKTMIWYKYQVLRGNDWNIQFLGS